MQGVEEAAPSGAGPNTHHQAEAPSAEPSAEELIARGEAPVKPQYVRMAGRVQVGAITGRRTAAGATDPQAGAAQAGAAEAAAAGGADGGGAKQQQQQEEVKAKSKKQMKKERKQQRFSSAELCTAFALGKCQFGPSCRFNHDVEAYLASKPPELPGSCPFTAAERCPYGITCRWASTHPRPDPLTQQYLVDKKASASGAAGQAAGEAAPAGQAEPAGESEPAGQQADVAMADAEAGPPAQAEGAAAAGGAEEQQESWYRRDGSIPGGTVQLPVSDEASEALNVLGKEVQQQLRKGSYDYSAADAVLASMGIQFHRDAGKGGRGRGRGGRDGGRGRGGRQQQQQQQADAAAAAGPANGQAAAAEAAKGASPEGQEMPKAKRQRLESAGGDVSSDAAFFDGLGAPASAQAGDGAQAAAAAAAAGGAGASAAKEAGQEAEGRSGLEGRPGAREKRTIDFRGKLFLAPLTTVGNLPFRRLCKRLGADITCGEMALGTNLLQGQPSEWALLKRHPEEDCFGVQLCGGYPDTMARCAQMIEDSCQVDFVDVNFGCPIDVVCSKGAGSACLLKPQRMEQIVRGMSSVLSCPLTFKMRKGYHDGSDIAHTLVPRAAGWGASAITLHGRTREQRYSRLADWPYIGRCVEAAAPSGIQMVGNGDVFAWEDHYKHLEECPGLATTYIARGALIKPWIFTEIKERRHWDISAGERLDLFKRFCSFGLEHWGSDSRGVETTRRFLLEWLSFTHRYIPVGLLEVLPQRMHLRPPAFVGRNDLETLLASDNAADWVALSEMLLGPAPEGFVFAPKHKANSFARREGADLSAVAGKAGASGGAAGTAAGGAATQPAEGGDTVPAGGKEAEEDEY